MPDMSDARLAGIERILRTHGLDEEHVGACADELARTTAEYQAPEPSTDETSRLRAELDAIRTHDETVGGVLYEVIQRAQAGELDDHAAVRQIEWRLIQPLVARMREARASASRGSGRRRRDHDELRDKRTDLLNIRGILKPAPGVSDPAVPFPLGDEVAPAIEWLVNDRDQLRAELAEAREERDAARQISKGRTMEQYDAIERAEKAEAEWERLAEQVKTARVTAAELHDFNSPEGEHTALCFGCRLERELGQEAK
ncbi:hypothetical protein [Actinomadura litoris]|uniref:hypothetical protein n=1 Tax=Actinomadura litoris TaxID=2678616 RepID=UPI001FA73968|nr:hypothetical protein [Actinomadura litoris]